MNIGDKVICVLSGVSGVIVKTYTPTASAPQIMVRTSDVVVIDPKENGYSSAESCRSSLRNAIKRYGYTSIKMSSINSLVYMYKRNL